MVENKIKILEDKVKILEKETKINIYPDLMTLENMLETIVETDPARMESIIDKITNPKKANDFDLVCVTKREYLDIIERSFINRDVLTKLLRELNKYKANPTIIKLIKELEGEEIEPYDIKKRMDNIQSQLNNCCDCTLIDFGMYQCNCGNKFYITKEMVDNQLIKKILEYILSFNYARSTEEQIIEIRKKLEELLNGWNTN